MKPKLNPVRTIVNINKDAWCLEPGYGYSKISNQSVSAKDNIFYCIAVEFSDADNKHFQNHFRRIMWAESNS